MAGSKVAQGVAGTIVRSLIAAMKARPGVDSVKEVNRRSHGDVTPLHLAAQMGNDEVVCILIEEGAEVDAVIKVTCLPYSGTVLGLLSD